MQTFTSIDPVQRDPYSYLLTQSELQRCKNLPLRLAMQGATFVGTTFYYLSRQNELGRVRAGKFSFDLVFGVGWRVILMGLACDVVSRRMFVDYRGLQNHKIADYEIRKIMRRMPNARPHIPLHNKPNSYIRA